MVHLKRVGDRCESGLDGKLCVVIGLYLEMCLTMSYWRDLAAAMLAVGADVYPGLRSYQE